MTLSSDITDVQLSTLQSWPLPMPDDNGDKEERGRLLIIGGSREIPGALLLAAQAALRAGAGKLALATVEPIALPIAVAMPEARVIALPESRDGGVTTAAIDNLSTLAGKIDAILIGPGMQDGPAIAQLVHGLLARFPNVPFILDATAMDVLCEAAPTDRSAPRFAEGSDLSLADTASKTDSPPDAEKKADTGASTSNSAPEAHRWKNSKPGMAANRFDRPVLITPHAGEMAHLTGLAKDDVQQRPEEIARDAARRWNAVVALKGATTLIAHPDGRMWRHVGGNVGLATSGSGDTLAGIIAGFAARGAPLEQACAWGVALHAAAGDMLAERIGPLGYLAREIPDELPRLLAAFHPTGV